MLQRLNLTAWSSPPPGFPVHVSCPGATLAGPVSLSYRRVQKVIGVSVGTMETARASLGPRRVHSPLAESSVGELAADHWPRQEGRTGNSRVRSESYPLEPTSPMAWVTLNSSESFEYHFHPTFFPLSPSFCPPSPLLLLFLFFSLLQNIIRVFIQIEKENKYVK